jgi:hypothetical protein
MRKKVLLLGIVTALLAGSLSIDAMAATKAGSSCKKLKMISISNGKIYTCIKSGKKLVWDKGALITTAQLSPSPDQSPTPKPSGSPTPKSSVAPVVAYPKGPTSFDDLIENYQGISYAAWSKSSEAVKSSNAKSPVFKAVTGPNTKLAYPTPAVAFDLVARLYGGYESAADFTVLSFGYEDRMWAQEQMKSIQPSSTYQWITYTACATKDTCWGGGMFTDPQAKGLLVLTTEVVDANHTTGTLEAHEYTHAVQQNQMRGPQPWPTTGNWPPTWYLEGQAEFSQNVAIYHDSFDLYTKNRREVSQGLFQDSKINSQWIQEYFVVNPPSNWFDKYDRWRQYDLGGMLVEVLAALKGPASTMEVWKLCGSGMTFKDSFEKVYGTSFDKALPIMAKAIALELGRS